MVRLTKAVRLKLLECNEGFKTRTYSEGKNYREERFYTITDGQLHIRSVGKTSWADSRFDEEWIASDEEVHRFMYAHLGELNTSAVE